MKTEWTATFTVDGLPAAAYEALTGHQTLYTVTVTTELNPNLRRPRSLRDVLRQMRDVLAWEYRLAAWPERVVHRRTVTIPNARYQP